MTDKNTPSRSRWRENLDRQRAELTRLADLGRDQLAIDRLGLEPVMPQLRARTRAAAWTMIVVLYVAGWGASTRAAIEMLTGTREAHQADLGPDTIGSQAFALTFDLAVLALAVAAFYLFRFLPTPPSPMPRVAVATRVRTYFVAFVGPMIGFAFMGGLEDLGVPTIDYPFSETEGTAARVLDVVGGAMAGPLEETALLGVVVVALRRAGYGWATVLVTAVVVRVPFHLYYGWSALGLAAWAVLMVALYRRTGTLLPIILAHATWNITAYPGINEVGGWIKTAIAVAGVLIVSMTMWRALSTDRRLPDRVAPAARSADELEAD